MNDTNSPATPSERVEFLKEAIRFSEGNIRSFDTKAQISVVAFVFSISPLWSMMNAASPHAAAHPMVLAMAAPYLVTIGFFSFVLWPVMTPPKISRSGSANDDRSMFFVRDPVGSGGHDYSTRLQRLNVESELTTELLKLSYIRDIKSMRFRRSLYAAATFYAIAFATFLLLARM